ncbi:hypothetical protein [Methylobacillus flagellatus]|uniref:Lipoprotein n=1 Tax=Methylobacillus flagellatus (strain ATCC 51484 / DSM 6875 / VKM B-1610 / KT) TaxID=265072 RepID=Q1H350_METFK|nr:hypothetical protein [Methylobacillus flagellatus]ABE49087.1 hypothetical protein Mfla_0819 [Methylobacillus flagellatus KT]
MKTITLSLITALTLAGCASTQTYKAPTQNYRLKGQDNAITINGAIFSQKKHELDTPKLTAGIYINGSLYIEVPLDRQGNGQATGGTFEDKSTEASCHSKPVAKGIANIDCMVFIDNEKTVTLTF